MQAFNIYPLQAFSDNYIWVICNPQNSSITVVDPGDAQPVIKEMKQQGLSLEAILITHKHADHVGGVGALKNRYPDARVYGPAQEAIASVEYPLQEGDRVDLPETALQLQVWDVPGHTSGHIAYVGENRLFCGDTLFAGGCGRVFDGTHEQLFHSLQRIAQLPDSTQIYCAHEYTLDNLGFAAWVEPDNAALQQRRQQAQALREQGLPAVPSSLQLEKATNPFLRYSETTVIQAAEAYAGCRLEEAQQVFTRVRQWKDREYD
ncbi:MAG: hydroxyacylglutathione hydrolase [gamma proteobacterium symbiont of Bathyaustriella thionipta]|nr:hydroxyacylglutathione hydrolase [gamma proteobacterium symbiont of Bathyaustriella thionipta]